MLRRNKHIPNVADPFGDGYLSRERRAEIAKGLREMADWMEQSSFPLPETINYGGGFGTPCTVNLDVYSTWIADESFVKRIGSSIRLIGGRVEKRAQDFGSYYDLVKRFSGDVCFRYIISRDAVCEPIEETVQREVDVVTDEERAEQLQAELNALTVRETRPVTVTRWDCPPALLPKEPEPEVQVEAEAEIAEASF